MRIFNKYIYLTLLAFASTACFDEPGNEIVFNATPELEFALGDSGAQGVFARFDNGTNGEAEIVVNLVGRQRSEAVDFTIEIGDLTTAIEGIHFDFPDGLSYSIAAGESSVAIPMIVYADEIEFDESLVLELQIATADIKISPNNANLIYVLSVVCGSDLGGTYSYSTTNAAGGGSGGAEASCQTALTGTGTLTPVAGSPGVYAIPDASFGVFNCVWSDSPVTSVTLVDNCGVLTFGGEDQYGDTYTITVTNVTDTQLTFNFVNTFGDGGTTVLTRTDSKIWPSSIVVP